MLISAVSPPLIADSRLHAQLIAGLARSGMVGVECDPNWSNLKSLRITPVARLSQRRQSDTVLLLLLLLCVLMKDCTRTLHSRE